MDKAIRNAIERTTQQGRKLLDEDFSSQLEGTFDVLRNGVIGSKAGAHLSALQQTQRDKIVAAIEHKRAVGMTVVEAVTDYVRDAAFTTLNRFVALKMLEARQLVQECITKGEQSAGYREFCGMAPGIALLPDSAGYRLYIESLFDEFSTEIKVLFDRRDAASVLWPKRQTFETLLAILNAPDLAGIWVQDETIGWVYQFFNSKEERQAMRDTNQGGSPAPRNSREMAVRNQFFTPRYVVEFLVDNTLGRVWYEMLRGQTMLKVRCRYMTRRPCEIFLKSDEEPREANESGGKTQQELLQEPFYVRYRLAKDPRELRILDPACGSGHFLLYCFDLLEIIYEEAWDANIGTIRQDYRQKNDLRCAAPELIVRHNLHGIDIDPRAAQICSFALWMRAHRSWQEISRAERAPIHKTNIVIAEPMPGESDLLDEFCGNLEPKLLGQLVCEVFERMRIAGDAGALLRIETDIAGMVAEARSQWLAEEAPTDRSGNPLLFAASKQRTVFEMERVTADFWTFAEDRLIEELHRFASFASNGRQFRRKLFVEDAERGFAFIAVCRQRFDVILMNPPFGDASLPSKDYVDESYGDTKGDVYKAFVEGSFDRLVPAGMLGIISSRNGFFLGQSEDWRRRVLLRLFCPIALADLGDGVLDAAVSTAAYILRRIDVSEEVNLTLLPSLRDVPVDRRGTFSIPKYQTHRGGLKRHQAQQELSWLCAAGFVRSFPSRFARFQVVPDSLSSSRVPALELEQDFTCMCLLVEEDKGMRLLQSVQRVQSAIQDTLSYLVRPSSLNLVPGTPFAYWVSDRVRHLFQDLPRVEGRGRTVKVGVQTSDDFRFTRCWWEVSTSEILDGDRNCSQDDFVTRTQSRGWVPFAKGGEYRPFSADIPLLINWSMNGREIKAWASSLYDDSPWSRIIKNTSFYFRPGVAFGCRLRRFGVVPFPAKTIFSNSTAAILIEDNSESKWISAYLTANISRALLGLMTPPRKNEIGYVANIPVPGDMRAEISEALAKLGAIYGTYSVFNAARDETHARFTFSALHNRADIESAKTLFDNGGEADGIVAKALELAPEDKADLLRSLAWVSGLRSDAQEDDDTEETGEIHLTSGLSQLISLAIGCVFGRFDIRQWLDRNARYVSQDPYEPLPTCPPSFLRGADGLPAQPDRFDETGYPIPIEWSGILVDEEHHRADICARALECLAVVLGKDRHSIAEEICSEFELADLREYFRNPRHFLQDHLNRYFKSRRRAPLYWQLSIPSKRYSVWLYFHRLTHDTLWRVLNDFLKPKLRLEERRLTGMRSESGDTPSPSQRRALHEQESFVSELEAFRGHLETIAPLWNPTLIDGVVINSSILWKLMPQVSSWQRELRSAWRSLCEEKYDWARLAMHLWPERIIPKCAADRSLAIAHGVEDVFWVEGAEGKWKAKLTPSRTVEELIQERSSPAVKSALNVFLESPDSAPTSRRRRKGIEGGPLS